MTNKTKRITIREKIFFHIFVAKEEESLFIPKVVSQCPICKCQAGNRFLGSIKFTYSELEFLKSLWGLGTEEE
jgi:hypothetical protein